MSRIKILPSEVVDQIAAGEVVERPAHMIKELIENSLDAGATHIEVDIREGGKYVRVTDDGRGIEPEDLALALSRHATSKIHQSEDLWNLHSYGFRGEALASIASVSRLTLTSRTEDAASAFRLKSEFGRLSEVEKVGGLKGTTLLVEELFNNVPARLKFLKSTSSETSQIKTVFKALALAYPQVEFRLLSDNELVFLFTINTSRKERAEQVLGIKKLYEGEAQREDVKAYALFADPNTTAKTSKNIWLFAQNRWIQDRSLQAAVMEAYRNLLMHGEYPIVAIWTETEPDQIDVNIHPTKSQVKFLNASNAFRAVQASLRDSLEKAPWVETLLGEKSSLSVSYASPRATQQAVLNYAEQNMKFSDPVLERTQFLKKEYKTIPQESDFVSSETNSFVRPFVSEPPPTPSHWQQLQILGQAHLTYIITQNTEALIFVDQHAAHERVLFEKLMQAWRLGSIEVQDFLFPLTIDLNPEQLEALEKKYEDLKKIGLYLETLGPQTTGIKASPILVKESALPAQIEKLAQQLVEQGDSFIMDKYIGDICATLACHSAVRAGQALSNEQMKQLLNEMDEFPLSTFCPHGRPVYVEYPIYKLEKDFGRIVT